MPSRGQRLAQQYCPTLEDFHEQAFLIETQQFDEMRRVWEKPDLQDSTIEAYFRHIRWYYNEELGMEMRNTRDIISMIPYQEEPEIVIDFEEDLLQDEEGVTPTLDIEVEREYNPALERLINQVDELLSENRSLRQSLEQQQVQHQQALQEQREFFEGQIDRLSKMIEKLIVDKEALREQFEEIDEEEPEIVDIIEERRPERRPTRRPVREPPIEKDAFTPKYDLSMLAFPNNIGTKERRKNKYHIIRSNLDMQWDIFDRNGQRWLTMFDRVFRQFELVNKPPSYRVTAYIKYTFQIDGKTYSFIYGIKKGTKSEFKEAFRDFLREFGHAITQTTTRFRRDNPRAGIEKAKDYSKPFQQVKSQVDKGKLMHHEILIKFIELTVDTSFIKDRM